ncbi:MAG TPA: L-aspartate oxidase [Prolixibacteraceae bacterium]|nr:L-aspartate oxidase [Prolixibacteraceae bacterium]HCU61528.1 L-aspartate oxidase [Prolixibacteraceae bacterium]
MKYFDTIVIGSGLAGLTAAYHASRFGTVAVITKSQLDTSNSYYAQGGIASVMSETDSFDLHIHDTLVAGRGLCDRDAVEILVKEGQARVKELIGMGMEFDKENGRFVLGLEGGHSKRRILHAGGDATGKALTCFMLKKVVEQPSIQSFEYTAAVKLLVDDGYCHGVQAVDFVTGKNIVFTSRATILATGGLSRVYDRSTNPHTATGDGIAMAFEVGAEIADVEFIQFHPSALYVPGQDAFLISEAVRGEGAWLLNPLGERFMKDIHPQAELAPRDVVAFSIYKQLQKHNCDFLHLSLAHLDSEKIKSRFSNIYQKLQEFNLDLSKDLIPIAPAAHYMVGGIRTDLDGETNIPGLFACGEVASTGVMGANRLASNSLLECLVFGKRASEKAHQRNYPEWQSTEILPVNIDVQNENFFLETKNKIAGMMSRNVGIVREKSVLEETICDLEEIDRNIPKGNMEYNYLKVKHVVDTCLLISRAALIREESRGGHIRDDFQKQNPDFKVHIIQQKNKEPRFTEVRR